MKQFIQDFKDFINQGSVMDMAVGIIIGGAFTAIVTALCSDIIDPFIALFTGGAADNISTLVIPGTAIAYGAFLSAVLNFLIIAFVVFLLVKGVAKVKDFAKLDAEEEEEAEPRTCPFCQTEIPDEATRCPHCTSILDQAAYEKVGATLAEEDAAAAAPAPSTAPSAS